MRCSEPGGCVAVAIVASVRRVAEFGSSGRSTTLTKMQTIPFVVGSVLTLAGGGLAFRSLRRCFTWSSAKGAVHRLDEETGRKRQTRFRAAVGFTTCDGREILFHSEVATTHRDYRVGDSVRVLYDPQNPKQAEIGSFVRLWLLPLVLLLFAAVFFYVSRNT